MSGSSYLVAFAGRSISIACDDAESTRLVEQLFGHLRCDRAIAPQESFRLGRESAEGNFALFRGGTLEYRGPCQGTVAAMLLDGTVYHLAVANREGALFHAGCVARAGRAVLLPGESGAGKTTLTAWLAQRGFDYLTDELVFLPSGSMRVEAFRRPLKIKRRVPPPLEALLAHAATHRVIETPDGFIVTPAAFGESYAAQADARLVVFPTYRDGAALELLPISAARTAMRLLGVLVNARQLPEHGLAQTTHLARTLPAYTLTWGDWHQLDEAVQELLERELSAPRPQSQS